MIILGLVLIVFGAGRFPEVGAALGKGCSVSGRWPSNPG